MPWTLSVVETEAGRLHLPADWRRTEPCRGVLAHAAHPGGACVSLLRPVPAIGPVPDSLSVSMALWEEVERDEGLGADYRRLSLAHCGRDQVREEWEWPSVLLRCTAPSNRFADWTELFHVIAGTVVPMPTDSQTGTTR